MGPRRVRGGDEKELSCAWLLVSRRGLSRADKSVSRVRRFLCGKNQRVREHGGCGSIATDTGQQHLDSRCAWCSRLAREQMRPRPGTAGAAQAQPRSNASLGDPSSSGHCVTRMGSGVSRAWASRPDWLTSDGPRLALPPSPVYPSSTFHFVTRSNFSPGPSSQSPLIPSAAHNVIPSVPYLCHTAAHAVHISVSPPSLGLSKTSLPTFEPVR